MKGIQCVMLLRLFPDKHCLGGPEENHIYYTMGLLCLPSDAIRPHKCAVHISKIHELCISALFWEVNQSIH